MNQVNLRLSLIILATLVFLLAACGSTADRAQPEQPDPALTNEITLADLQFDNGMRVVFSYDKALNGYSLSQRGRVGESVPFVVGEYNSLLALFLGITPIEVAVPELLLAEPKLTGQAVSGLENRSLSADVVTAESLVSPATLKTLAVSCTDSSYITGAHWNVPVQSTPSHRTYYSSWYGGKYKYVDSFLLNCTPSSYAASNWARHRIYYWNGINYQKHYEGTVGPWLWDIETKGSVRRYRRVSYDHNWNPSCGACKYGRQGKFRN